jgi:hypothetical protein
MMAIKILSRRRGQWERDRDRGQWETGQVERETDSESERERRNSDGDSPPDSQSRPVHGVGIGYRLPVDRLGQSVAELHPSRLEIFAIGTRANLSIGLLAWHPHLIVIT